MMSNSNDKTSFPHELSFTNRQVANLRNVFTKNLSTNIKVSKGHLSKMIQSRGFLNPLLKTGLLLIKHVIKMFAKSFLMLLGLTAAAAAADTGIHNKILGSVDTTLIISNDDMENITKIVKSIKDSGFFFF